MQELKVFVGIDLDENGISRSLIKTGKESLQGSSMKDVARSIIVCEKDWRAEVHNVKVEAINLNSDYKSQVYIDLVISWSIYHGCEDKNEADDEHISVCATYAKTGFLIFQIEEPRRPINDC